MTVPSGMASTHRLLQDIFLALKTAADADGATAADCAAATTWTHVLAAAAAGDEHSQAILVLAMHVWCAAKSTSE